MRTFIQDLRFGARVLVKSPGFTLAAVVTLALGIGVNSAIFSVVNAMLLRLLPVRAPEEIVTISKVDNHVEFPHGMSYVDFLDYREQVDAFDDLAAYTFAQVNFATDEGSDRMFVTVVSGNYFSMLSVDTVVGRAFLPEEGRPYGLVPVVVLSYVSWRERFGGDPDVVGRSVRLNGQPYTVIGVEAESFHGLHSLIEVQAFAPLTSIEEQVLLMHAGPQMQLILITALDSGLRRAEILSLACGDINTDQHVIHVRPEHAKSKKARVVPMGTSRLQAVVAWLLTDAEGQQRPSEAPLFAKAEDTSVKSVRTAWENTR